MKYFCKEELLDLCRGILNDNKFIRECMSKTNEPYWHCFGKKTTIRLCLDGEGVEEYIGIYSSTENGWDADWEAIKQLFIRSNKTMRGIVGHLYVEDMNESHGGLTSSSMMKPVSQEYYIKTIDYPQT